MSTQGASVYRKVQLDSAPPQRLLLELFRRLQGDLRTARGCIEAGDVRGKGSALDHALAILGQLEAALDHAAAPELCRNLASSYAFCKARILAASLRMKTAPLEEAVRVLTPIHEGFEEVIERTGQAHSK